MSWNVGEKILAYSPRENWTLQTILYTIVRVTLNTSDNNFKVMSRHILADTIGFILIV